MALCFCIVIGLHIAIQDLFTVSMMLIILFVARNFQGAEL